VLPIIDHRQTTLLVGNTIIHKHITKFDNFKPHCFFFDSSGSMKVSMLIKISGYSNMRLVRFVTYKDKKPRFWNLFNLDMKLPKGTALQISITNRENCCMDVYSTIEGAYEDK